MANYKNKKCVVCKELFTADDDIVVCPECGAPYHRKCYELNNKCIYESFHGTDKAYHIEHPHQEENTQNIKKCPRCNNENLKDANFCNKCGYIFNNMGEQNSYENLKNEIPFMFDPMGGVNPKEDMNGISAGEVAKFIGSNTPYYMNSFKKIKDTKKNKFNFSAFLFSGAWFLYRKQYKIGIILTTIVFSLIISSLFIDNFYSTPILKMLFNSAGISMTSDFNMNEYTKVYSELIKVPINQKILLFLPSIIKLFNFLIMIFCGIFANKIYYNYCVKTINKIKNNLFSSAEYNDEIQKKGGINLKIMWVVFFCYMIITFLPNILIYN